MKILKIFGIVVGIHVFALILIFANPGCSSSTKSTPSPTDTVISSTEPTSPKIIVPVASGDPSPVVSAPLSGGETSPVVAAPIGFDPNAPATVGIRFSPTRPGTAAAGTLEAQPVADVTPATAYTIVRGDSLWTIAKKHNLTISDLAAANNLKAGAPVRVGQKILIPSKAIPAASAMEAPKAHATSADAAPAAPKVAGDAVRHVVKPGETLGAIARKYGVKVGEIATANSITDPARIRPGMELIVPSWQSPDGKSAKPAPKTAGPAKPVSLPPVTAPRPDQDLDSGLPASSAPPPVIQIENISTPRKP